jgi:hypothetical protein
MTTRYHNFIQTIFITSVRAALGGVMGALFLMNNSLAMAGECKTTRGHFTSQVIVIDGCTSPVGLCISGRATGGIQGPFDVTVTTFDPSPNIGYGIAFVTTEGTIHTAKGDLLVRETGAAYVGAEGDVVTIMTIVGGAGEWAGATGRLRLAGLLPLPAAPGEESDSDVDYEGHVCVP